MEKIFEELIEENKSQSDYFTYGLTLEIALKLLQQVREATINECFRIADESDLSIADVISELPTDQIKVKEK